MPNWKKMPSKYLASKRSRGDKRDQRDQRVQHEKKESRPARGTIELDGTTLEGGGQLLRVALGLSSLTAIPVHITDIRGKRRGGGGLKAQHLTAVQWLASATNATVEGASLGSKELLFMPEKNARVKRVGAQGGLLVSAGKSDDREGAGEGESEEQGTSNEGKTRRVIKIEQPSNGSIGLVLQAILPFLLFSSSSLEDLPASTSHVEADPDYDPDSIDVEITGGTNVSFSPSFEYLQQVLFPMLQLIGLPSPLSAKLHERGCFSGGAGQYSLGRASFTITPFKPGTSLAAFELLDRGDLVRIDVNIMAPSGGSGSVALGKDPKGGKGKKGGKASKDSQPTHKKRDGAKDNATEDEALSNEDVNGPRSVLRQLTLDTLTSTFPGVDTRIVLDEDSSRPSNPSKGEIYLLLVAHTSTGYRLGRDWLYDRKIPGGGGSGKAKDNRAGKAVEEAMTELVTSVVTGLQQELDGPADMPGNGRDRTGDGRGRNWVVDEHLQDQLVVYQALARGRSVVGYHGDGREPGNKRQTLHTRTAQWVTKKMLGVRWEGIEEDEEEMKHERSSEDKEPDSEKEQEQEPRSEDGEEEDEEKEQEPNNDANESNTAALSSTHEETSVEEREKGSICIGVGFTVGAGLERDLAKLTV